MVANQTITLLHVSDVQFGRHHRFGNLAAGDPDAEFNTLFMRLDDDLTRLARDHGVHPEVIVASGDLAEGGLPSEFGDALEFLDRLSSSLLVPRRNVVIVPGNHDVNRKLSEAYFRECEGDERTAVEPFARKWEPFLRMFTEFYAGESDIAFSVEHPWTFWELEDLNLVVAGLNSTMRESHRDGDHYGWVGDRQLRWFAERLERYREGGWFRLGVVHHNPARGAVGDDESLRDADKLGDLLGPSLNLLLHGHTHDSKMTWLAPGPLPVFSTGSGAVRSEGRPPEVPNQYQVLRVGAGGIARWTRRYNPGRERWEGDTSCSARGDRWYTEDNFDFASVHTAFGGGLGAQRRGRGGERTSARLGRRDAAGEFLGRVREICELRHGGERTLVDAVRDDARFPYLRVRTREGSVAQSFPVGVVEGTVTEEVVTGFCREVFDAYRAVDPTLRCEVVYGGDRASEAVVRYANRRNVELRSFVEFQGIIDFRGYIERQAARLGSDAIYPPGLYVPQRLVYDVGGGSCEVPDAVAELIDWLSEPMGRFVLLLADFGNGKTFLLRELARRLPAEIPYIVPVLVELRSLEKARTLDQLIAQHLATAGERVIDLAAFPYMLRKGRIALLFDGFDELAQRVTYKRATEHFQTLLDAAGGDAKVIVTSRTQHFESHRQVRSALLGRAEALPSLTLCHLAPFDEPEIRAFLARRLGDAQEAAARYALIDDIKDLLGLSHNPRMLGFIAGIPEDRLRKARGRTGEITAAGLYRLLIDQWLDYEWDKTHPRGAAPTLSREQTRAAVSELALCLWAKLDRTIHVSELTEQVSATAARLSVEPHEGGSLDPDTIAYLIGSRTLLVRDEEGGFAFVHSSVMEWLVANEIAGQLRADAHARPLALAQREMTRLMTDFLCDLAGLPTSRIWARRALAAGEGSVALANALRVLGRLGEHAQGAQLAGTSLPGHDLSDRGLAGVDLSGADLTEARLEGADLRRANLARATLRRANLTRALLGGAALDDVDARGALLLGADMRGATLTGANLRRAKLVGALVDPAALALAETGGAALPDPSAPLPMLTGTSSAVSAVAAHCSDEVLASGHADGSVRLWNPTTGAEVRTLSGHRDWVHGVEFSRVGPVLVSASQDGTIRLWDHTTGAALRTITDHGSAVWGVALTGDGDLLASAGGDGTVRLWDVATGAELNRLHGHQGAVWGVALAVDGELLASAGEDGTVRIWDLATGSELRTVTGHRGGVWGVAWSPDGRVLASAGDDHGVRLWHAATGVELHRMAGHERGVLAVAFSPDGQVLGSASRDGDVRLWDPTRGTDLRCLSRHQDWVRGLCFLPDGQTLVSASEDTSLCLWDLRTGAELRTLTGQQRPILGVAFSADGKILASAGDDSAVRLWDPCTGVALRTLEGHRDAVWGVAYSPKGELLASASEDGGVRTWDNATTVRTVTGHDGGVRGIAFSPSGRLLASAGDDHEVRIWDASTGSERRTLSGHQDWVRAVAFSPLGDMLASAGDDRTVRVWDPATGTLRRILTGHERGVLAVAFSRDGKALISGSEDASVRVWDALTGAELSILAGHRGGVRGVAVSPDGRTLASASDDREIRLWDAASGTMLRTLVGHQGSVLGVAFSPDGNTLASAGNEGTVRLWDHASGALRATLAAFNSGYAAFTPDGRYRLSGRVGGAFWYAIGLCRFEPGELDDFLLPGTLCRLRADERL